jgi:hypothetical protein
MGDRDDHLLSEGHPDARGEDPAQNRVCDLVIAVRSLLPDIIRLAVPYVPGDCSRL